MRAKPWYTRLSLPGSSAVLENTTTLRQCYSICTGYRFVCARHIKCSFLRIRLCMIKHCVTSRNYYRVVNPFADWSLRLCRYWHYTVPASQTVTHGDRRFAVAAAALWNGLPDSVSTAKTQPQHKTRLKTQLFRLAFLWRDVVFNYIHLPIRYTIYIT